MQLEIFCVCYLMLLAFKNKQNNAFKRGKWSNLLTIMCPLSSWFDSWRPFNLILTSRIKMNKKTSCFISELWVKAEPFCCEEQSVQKQQQLLSRNEDLQEREDKPPSLAFPLVFLPFSFFFSPLWMFFSPPLPVELLWRRLSCLRRQLLLETASQDKWGESAGAGGEEGEGGNVC